MSSSRRYLILVPFAVAVLISACTGNSGEDPPPPPDATTTSVDGEATGTTTGEPPATTSSPTTTAPPATEVVLTVDPDTGEATEIEVPQIGPTTYAAVVDEGVDAGRWDEAEGLRLTLGYAVGAIRASEVPGVDDVLARDFDDVLDRVAPLIEDGTAGTDLARWYDLARPSQDTIAQLIDGSGGPQAFGDAPTAVRTSILAQGSGGCAPIDAEDFSDWGTFKACYKLLESSVAGATLRVLYPSYLDEQTPPSPLPGKTMEALTRSITTFAPLATVGDTTVIFSMAESTGDSALAVATDGPVDDNGDYVSGCPVTLFPSSIQDGGRFEQTIAHEVWHCVQEYSGYGDSAAKWISEGGAEYFSNVAYPEVNDEHRTLRAFDVRSIASPIDEASYAAWIWWQFLANETSPGSVAGVMETLGRSGSPLDEEYGPLFQKFTIWYVAGQINDASGALIPPGTVFNKPPLEVAADDKGKELEFKSDPFVATRYLIDYGKQLRIFQTQETTTGDPVGMVKFEDRLAISEWSALELEIRTKCETKSRYVLVSTSAKKGHTATVTIDKIEKAVCDPCVLGTWSLDLDTFEQAIREGTGQALPAGTSLDITGAYYNEFDDEGKTQEQRDGLTYTMSGGAGEVSFTIDSFGTGSYDADGERMSMWDLQDVFTNVTSNVPGFGQMAFPVEPTFSEGGSGTYACDDDVLTMDVDGWNTTFRWDRVDKILEPPPLEVP